MALGNDSGRMRMHALGRCLENAESALSLRAAPEQWILTMIERMLLHCEQQFAALSADLPDTPAQHAASARALGNLERTVNRLSHAHAQLRLTREQKVSMSDDQLRAKISSALDRAIVGFRAAGMVEFTKP